MLRKLGILLALSVSLVLAAAILIGCSSDSEKPQEEFAPPGTVQIAGVGINAVAIRWGASVDEGLDDFNGYVVYWNPSGSIRNILPPDLPASAKADTVLKGDAREYTIQPLDQGTSYFIVVRSLKDSGDFSVPSNEVNAGPRPQGSGTIYEFVSTSPSAFDLSEGDAVAFLSSNKEFCDVYLGTSQANDLSGDLYLKSPDQVATNPQEWTTRATQIKDAGVADNNAEYDAIATTTDGGWSTTKRVAVDLNHVYILKTPENHYAKIWIISLGGVSPNRTITFSYAYQPIVNYPSFSPRKP